MTPPLDDAAREYGIEYSWRDGRYVLTVHAHSPEEAMERIKAAATRGRCFTPHGIEMTVPAVAGAGLFVRAYTRIRSLLSPSPDTDGGERVNQADAMERAAA